MTLSSSPALNTRPARALIFMTSKNAGVTARPPQCAGVAASRIVTDSSSVRAGVESVRAAAAARSSASGAEIGISDRSRGRLRDSMNTIRDASG